MRSAVVSPFNSERCLLTHFVVLLSDEWQDDDVSLASPPSAAYSFFIPLRAQDGRENVVQIGTDGRALARSPPYSELK